MAAMGPPGAPAGGCCGGSSGTYGTICPTLMGCIDPSSGFRVAAPGETIVIKDSTGTTVGTATTGSTGRACIAIPAPGTYTIHTSSRWWTDPAHSVTTAGTTTNLTLNLVVASGFNCCSGYLTRPISNTLLVTSS